MNDADIRQFWSTLEPSARARARIERRVLEWIDASETSLLKEWLDLIKANPIGGMGLAAASALSLMMFTPLGWLVSSMLR